MITQKRPDNTDAQTLYNLTDGGFPNGFIIVIANPTGGAASASIFLDANGTNYGDDTIIMPPRAITASDEDIYELKGAIAAIGSIGIKSSVASALNFMLMPRAS